MSELNRSLKVLVISDRYPPFFDGGYELTCQANVNELKRRQHVAHVLTSRGGAFGFLGNWDQLGHGDVTRGLVTIGDKVDFKRRYVLSQVIRALVSRWNYHISRRVLDSITPDIVYCFRLGDVSFSPLVAASRRGIPIVADIGDYSWPRIQERFSCARGLSKMRVMSVFGFFDLEGVRIDHFIANSQTVEVALTNSGVPEQAITILPRYVGTTVGEETPERGLPLEGGRPDMRNELRVVYGGRLCEEKGIMPLLDIVNELKIGRVTRRLVVDIFGRGTPTFEKMVRERVLQLRLQDEVSFCGLVDEEVFVKKLRRYHVFLFPFLWDEPFGRVVIQAMKAKLLVVTSKKAGPGEIIDDGVTGFLVDPGNVTGFADVIMRISRDKKEFRRIGEAAYNVVKTKYTAGVVIPKLEKILMDCARSQ